MTIYIWFHMGRIVQQIKRDLEKTGGHMGKKGQPDIVRSRQAQSDILLQKPEHWTERSRDTNRGPLDRLQPESDETARVCFCAQLRF